MPEGIDAGHGAVLATAMSGMSMSTAAGLQPGETVLVQGATGVAGRLAVQIAKLLGAGRVVATGRDDAALEDIRMLGADAVINTAVPDDDLVEAYRANGGDGYDVVIDYLWGRPTELLSRALVPQSFAFHRPTRLVHVGESAGSSIQLTGDALRTSGLEIYGAARNLATGMAAAYGQVVDWVRDGAPELDVTVMPLSEIEHAWKRTDLRGSRLVIVPDRVLTSPRKRQRMTIDHETLGERAHDLMHRIPGMPAHGEIAVAERHRSDRAHGHDRPQQRHRGIATHGREPRVLVRWQNWIARLFAADRF